MQKKIRHVNRDQLSAEKPTSSNSFITQSTEVNEKFMIFNYIHVVLAKVRVLCWLHS